jgi:hypothetical protein
MAGLATNPDLFTIYQFHRGTSLVLRPEPSVRFGTFSLKRDGVVPFRCPSKVSFALPANRPLALKLQCLLLAFEIGISGAGHLRYGPP